MPSVKAIKSSYASEEYLLPSLGDYDLVKVDHRFDVPTTASMLLAKTPSDYYANLLSAYLETGINETLAIRYTDADLTHELSHAEVMGRFGLHALFSVLPFGEGRYPAVQTFIYSDEQNIAIPKIVLAAFAGRPLDTKLGLGTDIEYLNWMGYAGLLGAARLITKHNRDEGDNVLPPLTYNATSDTITYLPPEQDALL